MEQNRLRNKGLSAVIIAGSSDKYLDESLSELRIIADEIIFIDAGAADNALELADDYGCRIYDFSWCDDFAKAKNFGIEQANYNWILNVDTDEVPDGKKTKNILENILPDISIPAYIIYQDNIYNSGIIKPNPVFRLFQNNPQIRFVNPVHECISETLFKNWPGFSPPILNIHIKHYGFLPENIKGKHERNIRILRKWLKNEPDNIFANFKLGNTLFDMGQKDEAIIYLDKTCKLFAESSQRSNAAFLPAFGVVYHKALIDAGLSAEAESFDRTASGWIKDLYAKFPDFAPDNLQPAFSGQVGAAGK
ncbi:MAG TPA: hypothetical protein DCO75_00170, partial [Fibrobacteres bacterium]|jgi:glycosyltransferase involved in cell wall biosynthesis|nr:hypothetical protein [Fibrobacterota bacterium]